MTHPLHGVELSGPLLPPLWSEGQEFAMYTFLSTSARFSALYAQKLFNLLIICSNLEKIGSEKSILSHSKGLYFSNASDIVIAHKLVIADASISHNSTNDTTTHAASPGVLRRLRSNSSDVFLHVVLVKCVDGRPVNNDITSNALAAGEALYDVIRMIKHAPVPASFRHRYLLSDFGWSLRSQEDGEHWPICTAS